VAFIAGQSAPPGSRWDMQEHHFGKFGSAKEKIESLEAAGIRVAQEPSDIPKLLKK
jgi:succinyl-CoA synthetase alpha subunit